MRYTNSRYALLAICCLLTPLILILVFPLRADGNVGMLLEAGKKITDGQRLYIDFEENNLPTIHYINAAAVLVSQVVKINAITVYLVLVWLLLAFACISVYSILRRTLYGNTPLIYIVPSVIAAQAIFLWAITMYGEREHLISLTFVPWFVLRWHRWDNGRLNPLLAFCIGFLAVMGASIKPHFILLFLVGDAYWLISRRKLAAFFKPEIIGAVTFVAIYAVVFVGVVPQIMQQFVTYTVPKMTAGYDAWGAVSIADLILRDGSVLAMLLCVILVWLPRRKRIEPANTDGRTDKFYDLVRPLSLALVCAIFGYVIQRKGWLYHRIPMEGVWLVLLGLLLYHLAEKHRIVRRVMFPLLAALAIEIILVAAFLGINAPTEAGNSDINRIIEQNSSPGDSIIMLDTNASPTYPGLEQINRRQGLQDLNVSIPLAYFGQDLSDIYSPTHEPPQQARNSLDRIVRSIEVSHSTVILIRSGPCFACEDGFEIYKYLEARGIISNVMEPSYAYLTEVAGFKVFVRKSAAS